MAAIASHNFYRPRPAAGSTKRSATAPFDQSTKPNRRNAAKEAKKAFAATTGKSLMASKC